MFLTSKQCSSNGLEPQVLRYIVSIMAGRAPFDLPFDRMNDEDAVTLLQRETNIAKPKQYFDKPFKRTKMPHYITDDSYIRRDFELHIIENSELAHRTRETRVGTAAKIGVTKYSETW